jgi:hypothetical protein
VYHAGDVRQDEANQLQVITDSGGIIEVRMDTAGDAALGVYTDGWHFPRGI